MDWKSGSTDNSQNNFNNYEQNEKPKPEVNAPAGGSVFHEPMTAKQLEQTSVADPMDDRPMPVIKVMSVRGVEYGMMTLSLWLTASSLLWVSLSLVKGDSDFDILVYPASFLIVGLPVFGVFYLRLRKAELANPELRLDPSKRRWSQITQILAFIVCISNAIAFVYHALSKIAGDYDGSLGKDFATLVLVLLIAGGVLLYYWFDEHRLVARLRG